MAYAHVYVVTNDRYGTSYVGATRDLVRRAHEHRVGAVDGFTKRVGLDRIVWYEEHESIVEAIAREKRIKAWRRDWKVNPIQSFNPTWVICTTRCTARRDALDPGLRRDDRKSGIPAFAGKTTESGPGLRRNDMKRR